MRVDVPFGFTVPVVGPAKVGLPFFKTYTITVLCLRNVRVLVLGSQAHVHFAGYYYR